MVRRANPVDFLSSFIAMSGLIVEAAPVTAYLTSRILRILPCGHYETLCQRDCWLRDCIAWQRVVAVRINICWCQRLDNGYVSVSIEN